MLDRYRHCRRSTQAGEDLMIDPQVANLIVVNDGAVRVIFETEEKHVVCFVPYGTVFRLDAKERYADFIPGLVHIRLQAMTDATVLSYRNFSQTLSYALEHRSLDEALNTVTHTGIDSLLLSQNLSDSSSASPSLIIVQSVLEKLAVAQRGVWPYDTDELRVFVGTEAEHGAELGQSRSTIKRVTGELRRAGIILDSRMQRHLTISLRRVTQEYPGLVNNARRKFQHPSSVSPGSEFDPSPAQ